MWPRRAPYAMSRQRRKVVKIKPNEYIQLNDLVEVRAVRYGKNVSVLITAPKEVKIVRKKDS